MIHEAPRAAEHALDLRAVLGAAPDPLLVVDRDLRLLVVNQAGVDLVGLPAEQLLGRSMLELVHPDDTAVVLSSTLAVHGKSAGTPVEIRLRLGDGTWRWIEFVGADLRSNSGIDGIVVVVRDITRRRMWEVGRGDVELVQQVLQYGSAITLLLDPDGRITSTNAAFTRLLGHDPSLVVGRPLVEFCSAEAERPLQSALARCRQQQEAVAIELPMRRAGTDGTARPIRFEFVNALEDPVVKGYVVTGHDVSDLQIARTELEHMATHDALTGLANRSALLRHLERLLRDRVPVAAAFIDLDRFKPVNDLWGHDVGDDLLRLVAERLTGVVRPHDLVARVGGDEFVVVAASMLDLQSADQLAERIDAVLAEPYALAAGTVKVTASVGVSLSRDDSTVTDLLADADRAMYESKAGRRGEPVTHDPTRRRHANDRRRLADELVAGLERGEVVAHLQPIVTLSTRTVVAVEALARWNHPRLGVLGPLSFLALAEDAALDLVLGDAVLRDACRAGARLPEHVGIGVNLSVAQLSDRGFPERLMAIIAESQVDPSRLRLEITERDTISRRSSSGTASPEQTLLELHALGARLVLDDFGTGYSSLTHVRHLPLSGLKIDQSFVAGIVEHREDRTVIAAMIGMARALGLSVVAEGIENDSQLDVLHLLGCDLGQGYHFARPMPIGDLTEWVRQHDTVGTDHARRTRDS